METVVSGIRPTGNLHIGNYFGAVRSFLEMQNQYNCMFFIADWHSLTTNPKPDDIRHNVRTILTEYIACGLNPEISTIYAQSDVPEVAELYVYLNMLAFMGELCRCTTFKEKVRQNPDNMNVGLLSYPTLMAADILIHRADKVPVGQDQEQNMQMVRHYARRFNNMYNVDFFPEPQSYSLMNKAIRIPGLDGSGKMGKSEGNCIYLRDEPKVIKKKVMSALTDNGPIEPNSIKPNVIQNLYTLLEVVSTPEVYKYFDDKWNNAEQRFYGELKKQLAEDIINFTNPIRERIKEIESDTDYLDKILREGSEKARESAQKTLQDVRQIIGFHKNNK